MAYPHFDQVQRAYDELIADGSIKKRASQEQVEQDKGLLTRRAGFYSNQRDPSIGILKKTSGNNSLGYSVDLLIRLDGTFWDVATDNAGLACPVNGGPAGPDPALAADGWTKPTAELAGLGENGGGGTPGTDLTTLAPPYDEDKSVEFGTACNQAIAEASVVPDGGMIAVHSMRCAFDYYVAGMPWDACCAKHVDEFRAEYGLPPIG
jgi:hypothetical protein